MEQHIKLFANHSAYNAVKNQIDKPNVVMCQNEGDIHYNPYEKDVVLTFNVSDISNTYYIGYYPQIAFDKMEVDGIEQPLSTSYQFSSTGEHIIKLHLIDPTSLGDSGGPLYGCSATTMYLPNTITQLGYTGVYSCPYLTTIYFDEEVGRDWERCNFGLCSNLDQATQNKLTNCLSEEERQEGHYWGDVYNCD